MKWTLLLSVFLFFGCTKTEKAISFYHWKTYLKLSQAEQEYFNAFNSKKLYLRFFDVKWEEAKREAFPAAILQMKEMNLPDGTEIIPTIYIENQVLISSDNLKLNLLVENVAFKLNQMIDKVDAEKYPIKEVQIDCDWSLATKDRFFDLLESLRSKLKTKPLLSATIRLHQVKFFEKTGVPPIDKGVLMFYNMGEVTSATETNSILNLETAKPYLVNFDRYPLPLDVALPLFSWGVQFREDKVIQLHNNLNPKDLETNPKFERISDTEFKVKDSNFLNGTYVYKDDVIRLERVSIPQLGEAVEMLEETLSGRAYSFILFHLDEAAIGEYPAEEILGILN